MLSGIGDEAQLRGLGIEVKHALPGVGANYHDHLAAGILMEMSNSESYGISLRPRRAGAWNLVEYALFRSGPLASNVFEPTPSSARAGSRSTQPADRFPAGAAQSRHVSDSRSGTASR
jgi:choline dehydrogenase-like flavoprotein